MCGSVGQYICLLSGLTMKVASYICLLSGLMVKLTFSVTCSKMVKVLCNELVSDQRGLETINFKHCDAMSVIHWNPWWETTPLSRPLLTNLSIQVSMSMKAWPRPRLFLNHSVWAPPPFFKPLFLGLPPPPHSPPPPPHAPHSPHPHCPSCLHLNELVTTVAWLLAWSFKEGPAVCPTLYSDGVFCALPVDTSFVNLALVSGIQWPYVGPGKCVCVVGSIGSERLYRLFIHHAQEQDQHVSVLLLSLSVNVHHHHSEGSDAFVTMVLLLLTGFFLEII